MKLNLLTLFLGISVSIPSLGQSFPEIYQAELFLNFQQNIDESTAEYQAEVIGLFSDTTDLRVLHIDIYCSGADTIVQGYDVNLVSGSGANDIERMDMGAFIDLGNMVLPPSVYMKLVMENASGGLSSSFQF